MIGELETLFRANANSLNAEKQTAYLKGLFPFFGLSKPLQKQLLKEFYKPKKIKTEEELIIQLQGLWGKPEREFHHAALYLARKHKKLWTLNIFPVFEEMIRENSWWDTVDEIAAHLVGPLLQLNPLLVGKMDEWVQDPHMWIRRTALIYQLGYKEKTDLNRLFTYCKKTQHEKEFFIRKAIGWALREQSKTHPEPIRQFLDEQEANLSPLSLKEGKRLLPKARV